QAELLREGALNAVGYRLAAAGKPAESIAAFEYVTRRYPESANAWDSLSEAYEKAERRDDARRAVEPGNAALAKDTVLDGDPRAQLEQSLRARAARLTKP